MIYRSQAAKCGILGTLNCLEKESLDHPNTIINCLYEHWPESPLSFLVFGSAVLAHSSIGLFILPHHIFLFHLHTQSELSDVCMWHARVCVWERRTKRWFWKNKMWVLLVHSLFTHTSHQFPKDMQQAVNTRCATLTIDYTDQVLNLAVLMWNALWCKHYTLCSNQCLEWFRILGRKMLKCCHEMTCVSKTVKTPWNSLMNAVFFFCVWHIFNWNRRCRVCLFILNSQ